MEPISKKLFDLSVLSLFLYLSFYVFLHISGYLVKDKYDEISAFILVFMALFIVFGLTYWFARILIKLGLLDSDLDGIIRGSDWYPSLSRIQFFLWTFVIGTVFVWFSLLNFLKNGCSEVNFTLPESIIALLGITSSTTIASKGLTSFKYGKRKKPAKLPPLGTVFLEDNIPSLARYQMSLWTCIGILLYVMLVGTTVNTYSNKCLLNILPDIPSVLVFLMGISQATYLGGKYASPTPNARITSVIPVQGTIGGPVTIYGQNFGSKDKSAVVLFNSTDVEPSDWTDGKIKIDHLPQIDIDPDDNMCEVRVVTASETTLPYEYEINL